jgi:hypothetical protein
VTALGRLPGLTRAYDDHSDRRRPESPVITGGLPTSVLAVPVPPEEPHPDVSWLAVVRLPSKR